MNDIVCERVTSSGSREGVWAYTASKAYAPSRLPLEVTRSHTSAFFLYIFISVSETMRCVFLQHDAR
jgi:hypothetical protein